MLKKMCAKCSKIIPYGKRYCEECSSKYAAIDKEQNSLRHKRYDTTVRHRDNNKIYDSFYHTREWQIVRLVAISRDKGLCIDCLNNKTIRLYNTVHHIEPIKTAWHKRLDINNLICLCEACHQARHIEIDKNINNNMPGI